MRPVLTVSLSPRERGLLTETVERWLSITSPTAVEDRSDDERALRATVVSGDPVLTHDRAVQALRGAQHLQTRCREEATMDFWKAQAALSDTHWHDDPADAKPGTARAIADTIIESRIDALITVTAAVDILTRVVATTTPVPTDDDHATDDEQHAPWAAHGFTPRSRAAI